MISTKRFLAIEARALKAHKKKIQDNTFLNKRHELEILKMNFSNNRRIISVEYTLKISLEILKRGISLTDKVDSQVQGLKMWNRVFIKETRLLNKERKEENKKILKDLRLSFKLT
jgi:hypothetical protein